MTITSLHIFVPPVVIVLCIVLAVVIFRLAHKRRLRGTGSPAEQSDVPNVVQRRMAQPDDLRAQMAEREKMLIKRIADDPRDMEAYELLGQVYLVQGNLHDAAECFQQVVAFNPGNLKAVEQLNRIRKIAQSQKEEA